MRPGFVILLLALCATAQPSLGAPPKPSELPKPNGVAPSLKKYETKYYWMYTDLDEASSREASLRLTRMAQEYASRTAGFAGAIRTKFPVYLFKHASDYYTGGGMPGSGGMYDGERLMIIAGPEITINTWHTMQHEGFHQFAHAVIGGDIPTWANEGLAEYFGEGVWTGDGFVTGVIPPWRLKRIRETMAHDDGEGFKPIDEVMRITLGQWNSELSIQHYDQAWSMVHFLVHAEDGRYRKAFNAFMVAVGSGRPAAASWERAFGDSAGFEKRWKAYWNGLGENPTSDQYDRATVATIGSFLGRALTRKQTFADYAAFVTAANGKKLDIPVSDEDWLPPSLLTDAIKVAEASGVVSLEMPEKGVPRVIMQRSDGGRAVATIEIKAGKVKGVTTTFDDSAIAIAEAKRLQLLAEKDKAKALLQDALKRNPDSPHATEIRAMVNPPKAPAK